LTEDDVKAKRNRAAACIDQLKSLNSYVEVSTSTVSSDDELLTKDYLGKFQVVVSCDKSIASLVKLNEMCREVNAKFIAVESRGLAGALFCDFGKDFECHDQDGEAPITNIVTEITNVRCVALYIRIGCFFLK